MAVHSVKKPILYSITITSRSFSASTSILAHQLFDEFSKPKGHRSDADLNDLSLHLNSGTVESVLNRFNHWKKAHDFFKWASRQDGYSHNCYTYNAMASILSKARQKSILKTLVHELVNQRCYMSPGALGFLIRCLGNQRMVDEAVYLFEHASDLKCVPNVYSYNCLLEACAKDGRVDLLESKFREMKEHDKYTMTSVLQCYCNAGELEKMLDVFNRIKDRGWLDEHVFTVLIVTFCKWGKIDQCVELVETMESMGMRLKEKTFFVLIHGFVRQGRVDKAFVMFGKMKRYGFNGDLGLYSVLIEGLCDEKDISNAIELYVEMKDVGTFPDIRVIKKLISTFCSKGDFCSVNLLLEENEEKFDLGCLVMLYNAILEGLVKQGDVGRACTLLKAMMNFRCEQLDDNLFKIRREIIPNDESFSTVICGLCKTKEVDKALALLNDMISMGCKGKLSIYNDLIDGLSYMDRLNEIYEVLTLMKESGFSPTEFTHNSIFYCICKRGDLSAVVELLKKMRVLGHVPWIKHCTMLVQDLCLNGKVKEACNFLDDMVKIGFLPDMIPYSAVIDGLCKSGNVEKALELFRQLSSEIYVFDVVAHNILINGFCKAGNLHKAQEIFDEMLEKGLGPSIVTYNSIIDGLCKAGKIDEAISIFNDINSDQATIVTYTSLVDGLCSVGRSKDAINFWNDMREKQYAPNKISYTALIHGLCKCGELDMALYYFDEMKSCGYDPDKIIYLLLIESLILNGNTIKALEVLKEVVKKGEIYNNAGPKSSRMMSKAVGKLYEDTSTCMDVKALIESGSIQIEDDIKD